MSAFDHVLQRAEAELGIPEPRRSRILLEMASDLEDLYGTYRERGLGEAEARERAVRLLGASPEVLTELRREHGSRMAGLLDRLAGDRAHRLESALLALAAGLAVAGGGYGVAASGVVADPSPWVWAVAALAAGGIGLVGARALALYVRPARLGPRPVEALRVVVGVAAACLTVSALGSLVELSAAAGAAQRAASPPDLLWRRLSAAAGLSALGLTVALLLAGGWLLLRKRARAIEQAREALRDVLSGVLGAPPGADRDDGPHTLSEGDGR
ncbi:MAG TPA: hypothetical protein VKB18_01360 [Gemmatimonadota bacterium]|nr:hypothetical protein [Gemmatimonadota bacterium]